MKKINRTTYQAPTPEQHLDVVIGDEKQAQFHPRVKLKAWNNEANLSVGLLADPNGAVVQQSGEKLTWRKGHTTARFYNVGEPTAQPMPHGFRRGLVNGQLKPSEVSAHYELLTAKTSQYELIIDDYIATEPGLMVFGPMPAERYIAVKRDQTVRDNNYRDRAKYSDPKANWPKYKSLPLVRAYSPYTIQANPFYMDAGLHMVAVKYGHHDIPNLVETWLSSIQYVLARRGVKTYRPTEKTKLYFKHKGRLVKFHSAEADNGLLWGYINIDSQYNKAYDFYRPGVERDVRDQFAYGLQASYPQIGHDVVGDIINRFAAALRLRVDNKPYDKTEQDEIKRIQGFQNSFDWVANAQRQDAGWHYSNPQDGFEFDVVLDQKPQSDHYDFSITTKEFDFHYQPDLSLEEKLSGDSSRSPDVVGSYAVYHKTKKNNQYKTGKAFHIYRPIITDSAGWAVYGNLEIDTNKELLSVIIPREFIDRAVYPITIDPTFGYTTQGASAASVSSVILGTIYTAPSDVYSLTDINVYISQTGQTGAQRLEGAVYKSSDNSLIAHSAEVTPPSASSGGWQTMSFGNQVMAPSIGCILSAWGVGSISYGSTYGVSFDSIGGVNSQSLSTAYSTNNWPNPITWGASASNVQYSIYVDYSTAAVVAVSDSTTLSEYLVVDPYTDPALQVVASDRSSLSDSIGTTSVLQINVSDSTTTSEGVSVAQPRYWVSGGTGNWNSTTNWSVSSGGASGASVPTAANNVIFNASSGTGTATINSTPLAAQSIDTTGFTGTITTTGTRTLTIGGAATITGPSVFTVGSGTTWDASIGGGALTLTFDNRGGGMTINTNGVTINPNGGTVGTGASSSGTITMLSNFNIGIWPFAHTRGTFVTGAHTLTAGIIQTSGAGVKTLDYTNGTLALAFTSGSFTIGGTLANATITGNSSSQITMFGGNTFTGGGKTYPGTVHFNGFGNVSILDGSTFTNLTANAGSGSVGDSVILSATQIINGTLTLAGNSQVSRLQVVSSTFGAFQALIANSSISITNVDFRDITNGSGGTLSGSSVGDLGGNVGITATTPVVRHWIGGTGNWSDITHWSATAGGAGSATMPIAQDSVIFDDAAFTTNGQTVTIDEPSISAFDASAISSHTVNFTQASVTGGIWHYGDVALSNKVTYTTITTQSTFVAKRATHKWTSNGGTISNNVGASVFNIYSFGGTFQPQDDFVVTGTNSTSGITIVYGTFQPLGNVTTPNLLDSGTATKAFTGASGKTLSLSSTGTIFSLSSTGTTVTTNSMNMAITDTSATSKTYSSTSNLSWGNMTITGGGTGAVSIAANGTTQTFGTFTINAPKTVTFGSSTITVTTVAVTSFVAVGSSGNVITLNASSAGHAASLSQASGIVRSNWMSIQDSTATGGATFYAGVNSTNVSGNSGWIFNTAPVTVSDTTNSTQDVVNIAIADQINVNDTTITSEFIAVAAPVNIAVSDTTTTSDVPIVSFGANVLTSDTISTADIARAVVESNITVTDNTTINELVTLALTTSLAVADIVSTSDVPLVSLLLQIQVADSASLSELVNLGNDINVLVSDTTTLSESVAVSSSLSSRVVDNITITENILIATADLAVTVADTTAISELVKAGEPDYDPSASDGITISESLSLVIVDAGEIVVFASDTTNISESLSFSIDLSLIVSDAVSAAELITINAFQGLLQIATSDTTSLSESWLVSIAAISALQVNVVDNAAVSENQIVVIIGLALIIAASDSVTVSEALAILIVINSVAGFMDFFD